MNLRRHCLVDFESAPVTAWHVAMEARVQTTLSSELLFPIAFSSCFDAFRYVPHLLSSRSHSVAVSTSDSESDNPGSSPGGTNLFTPLFQWTSKLESGNRKDENVVVSPRSSVVERQTFNLVVAGSIPSVGVFSKVFKVVALQWKGCKWWS